MSPKKYTKFIEKNDKIFIFLYNLTIFVSIQYSCLFNMDSALNSCNSVIKKLQCTFLGIMIFRLNPLEDFYSVFTI